MLTRIAMAAFAISILGASADALAPLEPAATEASRPVMNEPSGVTVVEKNSLWPLKDYMSMDPCTVATCREA